MSDRKRKSDVRFSLMDVLEEHKEKMPDNSHKVLAEAIRDVLPEIPHKITYLEKVQYSSVMIYDEEREEDEHPAELGSVKVKRCVSVMSPLSFVKNVCKQSYNAEHMAAKMLKDESLPWECSFINVPNTPIHGKSQLMVYTDITVLSVESTDKADVE